MSDAPPTTDPVTGNWAYIPKNARIERWENVARVLRALPEHERQEHWNMGIWGEKTPCGTVACAAGHCGLDPWFRERGFRLDFRKSNYMPDHWVESLSGSQVTQFFGRDGTDLIFMNDRHRSVDTVIAEVESFLTELRRGEYD